MQFDVRRIAWLTAIFLFIHPHPRAAETLTFVHTAGLGEVYAGVSDDPLAPTPEEAAAVLKQLRAEHPAAALVDSGNRSGMLAMFDTNFALRPARLLHDLDALALNFGSRDMLYNDESFAYIEPREQEFDPNQLSFVSSAKFSQVLPQRLPKPEIAAVTQGRKIRVLGLATIEPIAPLLSVPIMHLETKNILDDALAALNRDAGRYDLNLILTDLKPEINDQLAQSAPPNTLIFEQALYGLLPDARPDPLRSVNGVFIVSKQDWWSADVVEVSLRPDGAPRKIGIESHPFNPWFRQERGWLQKIFSGAPAPPPSRAAKVILPRLNYRLTSYGFLKALRIGEDKIEEFRCRGLSGAERRRNANVYFYRLYKNGRHYDYVQLEHSPVPSMIALVMLIGFDERGAVADIQDYSVVNFYYRTVTLTSKLLPRYFAPDKPDPLYQPEDVYGVEAIAGILRQDLDEAIRLYREAREKATRVEDPYDNEDLFE